MPKIEKTVSKSKMNNALVASMDAETMAFQTRLKRAETALNPAADGESTVGTKRETKRETRLESNSRVVRDAFTMPENDYRLIAVLQERCLKKATRVSKSEVLRAGLRALSDLSDAQLLTVVEQGVKVPTGRPKST